MPNMILNYIRMALFALLLIISFFLFQAWQTEHLQTDAAKAVSQAETMAGEHFMPAAPAVATTGVPAAAPAPPSADEVKLPPSAVGRIIHVKTDVLQVAIDTLGGDIISVELLDYPVALNSEVPFLLLNDESKTRYIAESGLLGARGPDTMKGQALYTVEQEQYELAAGDSTLVVKLNWQSKDGVQVSKFYTFTRDSYDIHVAYEVNNKSSKPWHGSLYTQLMRTDTPPVSSSGLMNLATYFGAAISSPQKPFEKISFKQMKEKNLNQTIQGGWTAMIQHYFIAAWIPAKNVTSTYYTKALPDGLYAVGMINQPITAAPGATAATSASLYAGPAMADRLEKAATDLNLTIDYGWFWMISAAIFWMMQKIFDVIGNWGWSIVLVTVIIKILFYQLSAKSYRSMSKLKKLQPRIEILKERYGDDKQSLTKATLELYREAKVNPMSGCLPILIQIPVFIALYWVLVESVQLRQAPFIFWIRDLSQHDPYYVLPILMGISMFLQQRLNPPPPDPMQAKVMMLMPVIFTFLFANFPAGLMLYWFVNNSLSYLQQWYIMHSLEQETNGKR